MDGLVYLDNSATTVVDPRVAVAMAPFFEERYGNPSSMHRVGRLAFQALDEAREKVSSSLGGMANEIVFTGGGTESDNLAIIGFSLANRSRGDHIISTQVEHPAVTRTLDHLRSAGFRTTLLPVDRDGLVSMEDLKAAMTPDTILVSIVAANNEVGTVQDIRAATEIAHDGGAAFHTDAIQAVCRMPLDTSELGVDMLSLAAHKFHGPKGVGALFVRQGTKLQPLLHGGGQEKGLRSSTENVPGIVGLGEAMRIGLDEMDDSVARMRAMRDELIEGVLDQVDGAFLNGHRTRRLCHNVHVCLPGVNGEMLVLALDSVGYCVSTGSACSSKGSHPSTTLKAMGLSSEQARSSIRLTLSKFNRPEEIKGLVGLLPWVLGGVRSATETMRGRC